MTICSVTELANQIFSHPEYYYFRPNENDLFVDAIDFGDDAELLCGPFLGRYGIVYLKHFHEAYFQVMDQFNKSEEDEFLVPTRDRPFEVLLAGNDDHSYAHTFATLEESFACIDKLRSGKMDDVQKLLISNN